MTGNMYNKYRRLGAIPSQSEQKKTVPDFFRLNYRPNRQKEEKCHLPAYNEFL